MTAFTITIAGTLAAAAVAGYVQMARGVAREIVEAAHGVSAETAEAAEPRRRNTPRHRTT